jgi:hypothetical protein
MKTVTLAEFNREYHTHSEYEVHFTGALERFLEEVMLWKAATGVEFQCELISVKDNNLMCNVSKVVAKFDTDADYAMYKLCMPAEKKATEIRFINNEWVFSGWTKY